MCDVVSYNERCSYSGMNLGLSGLCWPDPLHESIIDNLAHVCAVANLDSIDPEFASPGKGSAHENVKNYK